MPFTLPPRTPSGPRRRSLLASTAGAFVLVGCSAPEPSTDTTVQSPSAADIARSRAARDSESLAARYAAVITAHPPLAARLKPLRAEVVRHAQALGGSRAAGSRPSGSPSASASAHPSPSPTVPAQEKDALADLATAERTLADQRTKTLLTVPGELARLLASVAAAGAAHAFLLTEGAK
ncbi:hypothetical protein [Streptomyces mirabilis]|uniref:hypothetical protein n=1 Tax=Streptomyces mirabilis TaxID=68239 RepID=UPI003681E024